MVCRQLGKIPIGKICELHSSNLYKCTVSNTKLMNFWCILMLNFSAQELLPLATVTLVLDSGPTLCELSHV